MSIEGYTPEYYLREAPEFWYNKQGLLRPDQLAAICYAFNRPFWSSEGQIPRNPGLVVSIGCGEGFMERQLERMGVTVIGVDPSPGAEMLYRGHNLDSEYRGGGDTIIFCESIEHIPTGKLGEILRAVPSGARIIVVNWPDFFPIEPDGTGWDHVTKVDDVLYDAIATHGVTVIRRGSHLVVDKS